MLILEGLKVASAGYPAGHRIGQDALSHRIAQGHERFQQSSAQRTEETWMDGWMDGWMCLNDYSD